MRYHQHFWMFLQMKPIGQSFVKVQRVKVMIHYSQVFIKMIINLSLENLLEMKKIVCKR